MQGSTPTAVAPLRGDAAQHETILVYFPDEVPAWKETDELRRWQAPAIATVTNTTYAAFAAFAPALHVTPPEILSEIVRRLASLDRESVIRRYRAAYSEEKWSVAYLMAGELIARGIPPCFWHEALALDSLTVRQKEALTLADLAWLRRRHPDHVSAVRYQRGKALLTGNEAVFGREAAFLFYQGQRPAWKIVGTLSMTLPQQWESAYLRSTPVRREAEVTATLSARVRQALHDDLQTIRRTSTFNENDANESLSRRHALWHCSRMVKSGSPTEIAMRYEQMTGNPITRQTVAKQLEKVRSVLQRKGRDFME